MEKEKAADETFALRGSRHLLCRPDDFVMPPAALLGAQR